MRPEILAIFIPIIFLVGLFVAISLNIYYKYKARVSAADHVPGESLYAWCRAEAMSKASVSRSAAIRLGGFLAGAGIGMALGMYIGGIDPVWTFFGNLWNCEGTLHSWDCEGGRMTLYAIFIMACAMLVGGSGMIGTYFIERASDRKNRSQTTKK